MSRLTKTLLLIGLICPGVAFAQATLRVSVPVSTSMSSRASKEDVRKQYERTAQMNINQKCLKVANSRDMDIAKILDYGDINMGLTSLTCSDSSGCVALRNVSATCQFKSR